MDACEKSVSVRWDAEKTDIRGPYYTGAQGDEGVWCILWQILSLNFQSLPQAALRQILQSFN